MSVDAGVPAWVLLILLALTSATLCIAPPPHLEVLGSLCVGTVYGALLAVYFATCGGGHSFPKLVTFVFISTVAWPIAFLCPIYFVAFIPGAIVGSGSAVEPGFSGIAFGGVLGGVALLSPTLLLFNSAPVNRRTVLRKAFGGILLSGIVGGAAWELGPTLGAAIWAILPREPLPPPDSYGMAALFLVWQPLIALFIGWAASENHSFAQMQPREAESEVSARANLFGHALNRRVFLVIVVILAALSLSGIIPIRLRLAHREGALAKMKREKSTIVDLPLVQPMTEDEALILKQIGNYQPSLTRNSVAPASDEQGFEKATRMYFDTFYTKTGESVPPPPAAPRHYIHVEVEQYPNSAWAQFFAEYPSNRYNSFDDPKHHAIVLQFNNKVRSDQLERSPGDTSVPLYYMWPSGDCVITIEHDTPDEDLEIERAYLKKYPSSIS